MEREIWIVAMGGYGGYVGAICDSLEKARALYRELESGHLVTGIRRVPLNTLLHDESPSDYPEEPLA